MSRAAADTIHGVCVLCCVQDACLCLVDKKKSQVQMIFHSGRVL